MACKNIKTAIRAHTDRSTIYIYIYIYREREREKAGDTYIGYPSDEMNVIVSDKSISICIITYVACLGEYTPPKGRAKWIFQHPAQCIVAVSQIGWAHETERAIRTNELQTWHQSILRQLDELTQLLQPSNNMKQTKMITAHLPLQRAIVQALLITDIHGRDIVESLVQRTSTTGSIRSADRGVSDLIPSLDLCSDFHWTKQMRYMHMRLLRAI